MSDDPSVKAWTCSPSTVELAQRLKNRFVKMCETSAKSSVAAF